MPGRKKGVPEILDHTVAALIRQGKPRQQAWAIGVAGLQRAGILKKGSLQLTKKGQKYNKRHLAEPKSVRLKKDRLAKGKKK